MVQEQLNIESEKKKLLYLKKTQKLIKYVSKS